MKKVALVTANWRIGLEVVRLAQRDITKKYYPAMGKDGEKALQQINNLTVYYHQLM
ncbi:MAG: hypothetical protein R3B93_15860 [Bacteroidia bacterium]